MHEYIHSITVENNPSDSSWSIEGAARYFSYKYDYYGIAMLNADYNMPSGSKESLFVAYMVSQFGEDEVIDMIFSEQGMEQSLYTELVDDWASYIKTNYEDYSKYK